MFASVRACAVAKPAIPPPTMITLKGFSEAVILVFVELVLAREPFIAVANCCVVVWSNVPHVAELANARTSGSVYEDERS